MHRWIRSAHHDFVAFLTLWWRGVAGAGRHMLTTTSNAKYIDGFATLTMTRGFRTPWRRGVAGGRAAHANYHVKCQIHRWIRYAHHDSWFSDALAEGSGWGRAAHANYDVKCQIHRWIRFAHHDFVVS